MRRLLGKGLGLIWRYVERVLRVVLGWVWGMQWGYTEGLKLH